MSLISKPSFHDEKTIEDACNKQAKMLAYCKYMLKCMSIQIIIQ